MAWVKMISEAEASGQLREIYSRRNNKRSKPTEIVKVFSTRPELMDVRVRFGGRMTFGGSGLGRYREELIAVSISAACSCRY